MAVQKRRKKNGTIALGITWCERTWTWIFGCDKASPGCKFCWASDLTESNARKGLNMYEGLTILSNGHYAFNGQVRADLSILADAFTWGNKPSRVFVNSHSDTFHKDVKWEWLDQAFLVMSKLPHHIFQILTKRADVMLKYLHYRKAQGLPVLPHVHMGFTGENQEWFDKRWKHAKKVAEMGWLVWASIEPQLGPISVAKALTEGLGWCVVGGENTLRHSDAREFHLEWAERIVKDCDEAGVPVFVKQMGVRPFYQNKPVKFSGEGKHWIEWPRNLQRQEYPSNKQPPQAKKAA